MLAGANVHSSEAGVYRTRETSGCCRETSSNLYYSMQQVSVAYVCVRGQNTSSKVYASKQFGLSIGSVSWTDEQRKKRERSG